MRRLRLIVVSAATALTTATALAAVGCQEQQQQQPGTRLSTEWPGWGGTTTIDPAGDVQKLQGTWSRVPQGEGPSKWPEAYLVFDGDTATYESPNLGDTGNPQKPGQEPHPEKYQFVLNSSIEPKVMRYTHRLNEGEAIALPRTHQSYNKWYKLDGDSLTVWNHITENMDRPKVSYRRVKGVD